MPENIDPGQSAGERILVADDSLVIRKAIEKHLKADFEVVLADNGETAWDILTRDSAVKVLITDIEMPRLDGYGLICRVRAAAEDPVRSLPVIAITGAEDEETKMRAFACGATDFVIKPIDPIQLHARVHAHVRFADTSRRLAQTEAALEDESVTDPLTGLCSRRYFRQRAEQELAHAVRHGRDFIIARLDVDCMKQIYARLGDDGVEEMLVWLAGILRRVSRNEDTVARIGGAEFAVLAVATGADRAEAACGRICSAVAAEPFVHQGEPIPVTVSIGYITMDEDRLRSLDEMLVLAERRLVHARSEGGNRVSMTVRGAGLTSAEELSLASPDPAVPEISVSAPELEALLPDAEPALAVPQAMEPSGALLATLDSVVLPPSVTEECSCVPEAGLTPSPLPGGIVDLLSVDRALAVLREEGPARIEPWADGLMLRVLPLLEHFGRRHGLGLEEVIADIRARLVANEPE